MEELEEGPRVKKPNLKKNHLIKIIFHMIVISMLHNFCKPFYDFILFGNLNIIKNQIH